MMLKLNGVAFGLAAPRTEHGFSLEILTQMGEHSNGN